MINDIETNFNAVSTAPSVKNIHINHLEDVMFLDGIKGLHTTFSFIEQLYRLLNGQSNYVNITTKWDGSPAIVFGKNPDNGKQFIATKSAFNKEPKLIYSFGDVEKYYQNSDLGNILGTIFLSMPNVQGIYQGDLMFTHETLIDKGQYYTFTPNTITYAVEKGTNLGSIIYNANIGIVVHTKYIGDTFATLQPCYNFNIGELPIIPDVWFRDASFSIDRILTDDEKTSFLKQFKILVELTETISPSILNKFVTLKQLQSLTMRYINDMIRKDDRRSMDEHDWFMYIRDDFDARIINAKKPETKIKITNEKNELTDFVDANFKQFERIFCLWSRIVYLKMLFMAALDTEQPIKTFIGNKPTSPEGYVLSNKQGQVVKLVDRYEFSYHNFKWND
jgi:hypothetical protein